MVCVYSPTGAVMVTCMAALTCLHIVDSSLCIVCAEKKHLSRLRMATNDRLNLKGNIFSDGEHFLFSQFYNI